MIPCPHGRHRLRIRRSENLGNDRGGNAAVTIVDGPSPIVNINPSN
jgi:hypothetical protein